MRINPAWYLLAIGLVSIALMEAMRPLERWHSPGCFRVYDMPGSSNGGRYHLTITSTWSAFTWDSISYQVSIFLMSFDI